jgi:hypothetical protein
MGKKELLFQKASENLSAEQMKDIDYQMAETKRNLVVHEYQSMMMVQKMDTIIPAKRRSAIIPKMRKVLC